MTMSNASMSRASRSPTGMSNAGRANSHLPTNAGAQRPTLYAVPGQRGQGGERVDLQAMLPARLCDLLQAGTVERQSRFQDDRFDGMRERWTPPANLTPGDGVMARDAIAGLDRAVLAPADPSHVLGRILALLSHYPARAQTADVEQMIALDWAEDLGEFPAWTIDQAARQWRRSQKWRPSIAEMRSLCEEIVAPERALRMRLVSLARKAEERAIEAPAPQSRQTEIGRLTATAIRKISVVA